MLNLTTEHFTEGNFEETYYNCRCAEVWKKYDTPKDYTYYKSDEENKENCTDIVTISKQLKEQCEIYNLQYYETSYDREQVFKDFLDLLSK